MEQAEIDKKLREIIMLGNQNIADLLYVALMRTDNLVFRARKIEQRYDKLVEILYNKAHLSDSEVDRLAKI